MAHKVNLDTLTSDETKELAVDCLNLMTLDDVTDAIKSALGPDDIDELASRLAEGSSET